MVDLEKAFDSVWIDGLLWKMHSLGITGNIWCLIKDFLYRRKFKINVNGFRSEEYQSYVGVPQGSVLSPILFTIFLRDMCDNCYSINYKYADDLTLLTFDVTLSNAILSMQLDVDQLTLWFNKWRIKASIDKTKGMVFNKSVKLTEDQNPVLFLNGQSIEFPTTIKVLGILMDSKLSFKQQFEQATNKASQTLNILKKLFKRP